jgi:hypothetical protein
MTDDIPTAPSSTCSLAEYTASVDVLLDRVQMGVDISLPTVAAHDIEAFCERLYSVGVLPHPPRRGEALKRPLEMILHVVGLREEGEMTIQGRLALSVRNGHLVITPRSYLLPGAMRALRSQLADPGQKATDGADNLVWPWGADWQHLLSLQLENVAEGLDVFLGVLAAAARTERYLLRGSFWVQQCEVCRDFLVPAAEDLVHDLSERGLPGAGSQQIRPAPQHAGNGICVVWHEGRGCSPWRKAYPKRRDLLRTEIMLRSRPAVKALLQRQGKLRKHRSDLSGHAAADLLNDVAIAAAPLLDDVQELVHDTAQATPRNGLELMVGLAPLLHLAKPGPRTVGAVGRPPSGKVTAHAWEAIRHLILHGRYHAKTGAGMSSSSPVVVTLKEMAAGGVLTAAPTHRRLFVMRPEYEAARRALAAAR